MTHISFSKRAARPGAVITRRGKRYKVAGLFIGGQWTKPASGRRIEVISASTEEEAGSVPEAVETGVDAAVAAAWEEPA